MYATHKYLFILTSSKTETAQEAMRVIREQHELGRPFFLNLWFDAPHRFDTHTLTYIHTHTCIHIYAHINKR